jgi:hypothetical protein
MANPTTPHTSPRAAFQTLAYLLPALTMAFRRAEKLYKERRTGEGWTVQVRWGMRPGQMLKHASED